MIIIIEINECVLIFVDGIIGEQIFIMVQLNNYIQSQQ